MSASKQGLDVLNYLGVLYMQFIVSVRRVVFIKCVLLGFRMNQDMYLMFTHMLVLANIKILQECSLN